MTESVELFFSFRSPFSYLAGPRAFALADSYDIELIYRGIRPMVTRGVPLPTAKKFYIFLDAAREAERLGMPFGKIYDPLGKGALRCLYVAEHAAEAGRLPEFVLGASRAIWAEGVCVAGDKGLRKVCEAAGLSWDDCREAINNTEYHDRIESNNARLSELGHWGVPTFHYKDELFWGQDRIPHLEKILRADGLAK